eukprot:751133-Hanusia_phi.AAC.2
MEEKEAMEEDEERDFDKGREQMETIRRKDQEKYTKGDIVIRNSVMIEDGMLDDLKREEWKIEREGRGGIGRGRTGRDRTGGLQSVFLVFPVLPALVIKSLKWRRKRE